MEKFVVDVGPHPKQLPNLSVLERNFQDLIVALIGERLYFGIEHFDGRHVQRRDKVTAVLDLLLAFSAKHHGAKNLGVLYTEHVYGKSSASFI
jgi:hypothetical protein